MYTYGYVYTLSIAIDVFLHLGELCPSAPFGIQSFCYYLLFVHGTVCYFCLLSQLYIRECVSLIRGRDAGGHRSAPGKPIK